MFPPDAELRAGPKVGAGDAGYLRRLNLERILAVAMDHASSFTRAELIQATGLSAPTVSSLVSHLIRRGLVRERGTGPSRGGRRPAFMEFNARHGFVAGIDIGSTTTRLALADLRGERVAMSTMPAPSDLGPAALLAQIAAAVRDLLMQAGVCPADLLAVGVGAPGAVDRGRGVVLALAPNLTGWSNVPVGKKLEAALGAPVVVENDVNLAVLGERWRGAAHGHDTCAFVSVGTGIGAGIVVEGELHRGHRFLAGEIALMCMGPQFVEADFGTHGCLETLAGLRALAARWPRSGLGDPDRWVARMFEAAQGGDRQASRAIEEAATLIGIATANLSLVLDPSLIVLGGPVAQERAFVEKVRQTVGRILPAPTEIVPSTLDGEAPLWGSLLVAVAEARERLRSRLREVSVPA